MIRIVSILLAVIAAGLMTGCGTTTPPGFTRYRIHPDGDPKRGVVVVDVGNWAWTQTLEPKWAERMAGRCFPFGNRIEILSHEQDAKGRWIPSTEVLGHEIWHLRGLGFVFHGQDDAFASIQ